MKTQQMKLIFLCNKQYMIKIIKIIDLTFMAVLALVPNLSAAAECSLSNQGVSFGNYSVYNSVANDTAATVTVTCDISTAFTLSANGGTTASASINQRKLASNNDTLNYNLYIDAARATIWGDGATGSVISGTGTSTGTQVTIYGRIPANQNVYAGAYSDTVTITLNY